MNDQSDYICLFIPLFHNLRQIICLLSVNTDFVGMEGHTNKTIHIGIHGFYPRPGQSLCDLKGSGRGISPRIL